MAMRCSAFGKGVESHDTLAPMFSISLAQWSLYRTIFAGKLHPLEFPRFASETFGINAVEYVNRCFKDHYADDDLSYIPELKQRCDDVNVQSLVMMIDRQGDLADPDASNRTAAVENHYKWVEGARQLGCHSIRVNAGGPSVAGASWLSDSEAMNTALRDAMPHAVDGLRLLAEFAEQFAMNILVENHGGYSSHAAWLAEVIRRVDHPCCGTLPDFGNFCMDWTRRDEPAVWYDRYDGVAELMPYAKAVSAKSNAFNDDGSETTIDYARMLHIVRDAGYRGHIGIEYEGPVEEESAGIRLTHALLKRVMCTMR